MSISRRRFLTVGGAAVAGAASASVASGSAVAGLSPNSGSGLAWTAGASASMPLPSPALHLLNRATFGPTRAELQRVEQMGIPAWIEEQIRPDAIDDSAVETALSRLESLEWSYLEIKNNGFQGPIPVANELVAATLYRAVHSKRQLFECMVDLWSNHFNVFHPEELISRTKTVDDREAIRKHAMGSFRDLVQASSASTSMMRYLNTVTNRKQGPNENFARELMELHTLGVEGGYSEDDIKQVARCFTGWNYDQNWGWQFRAGDHDTGAKTVLGQRIRSSGADEGREVIDLLVDQPACAYHVARQMVRYFVADDPPEALAIRVAQAFGKDGDIPAMLRVLLNSQTFADSFGDGRRPAKVKRPMAYWSGALRAAEVDAGAVLEDIPPDAYEEQGSHYGDRAEGYLQRMDHLPFRWPAPDGYPEDGPWWSGMHVMVNRWNFAMMLSADQLPGIDADFRGQMGRDGVPLSAAAIVDYWVGRILMREILPEDRQLLVDFMGRGRSGALSDDEVSRRLPFLVALLYDSPYFQWR